MRQRGKCCAGAAQGLWEPGGADPARGGWGGVSGARDAAKGTVETGLEVWLDGKASWGSVSHSKALSAQAVGASESQGALLVPGCQPPPGSPNSMLPLQEYIQKLMPPLIQKWNELKDEDKDLFPLLEVGGLQALPQCPAPSCPNSPLLPSSLPVPVIGGHCPAERLPALLRARLPALRHPGAEDSGPGHGEHPPTPAPAPAPLPLP